MRWSDCCHPKDEGGLGIRNIFEWNRAAITHQLWRIIQPNACSIWVRWFQNTLLKNKGLWTSNIPYKCSWGVQKIFKCRDHAITFIRYHVGRCSNFKFWHDPWILNSPLMAQYSSLDISNFESNHLDLICRFQRNGEWLLPPSNYLSTQEIRAKIAVIPIFNSDHITWDGVTSKSVSTSVIWHSIRNRATQPTWSSIVWNSLSVGKCSFILWAALKNRLLTRDRMLKFNMQTSPQCLFCNAHESVVHLFTNCPYFDLVRRACPVDFSHDWRQCQVGAIFNANLDKRYKLIGSLFLSFAVYLVWKERNYRVHNIGPGHGTFKIIAQLKQLVREKLYTNAKFKKWARTDTSLITILY